MQYNLPDISIMMVSFNHEKYIAQALDSVLNQKTSYNFEIVLSDDCSTDNTKHIISEYASKYPDIIKAYYQQENIGMGKNWLFALSKCKGTYIALLEGDDYWVGNEKLQKQVDFLENNKEYSICFNRVWEQIGEKKHIASLNPWDTEMTFSIVQLADYNFMHTNSVMFKNDEIINRLPNWFDKSPAVDYVIHLLNAQRGLIKYFPELMGVYRLFAGTWSTQTRFNQIKKVIQVLDYLLQEQFDNVIIAKLVVHKQSLISGYFEATLNNNDFSYIDEMDEFLKDESFIVRHWMLNVYPTKLKGLLNSRVFKFVRALKKIIKN